MSLDAIALLRLAPDAAAALSLGPPEALPLADAMLLRTSLGFAAEPHELAAALRVGFGPALAAHRDPRGVFVLPSVALEHAQRAGSYEAVIDVIGEAGMWVPLDAAPPARTAALEALMARAMEGEEIDPEVMQAAMRDGVAQMAAAFAAPGDDEDDEESEDDEDDAEAGHPALDLRALLSDPAMMALAEKMRDLMPPHGEDDEDDDDEDDGALDRVAEAPEEDDELDGDGTETEVDGAMPDLGALMRSPAFAEMIRSAQEILSKNPDEARKLAERFGLLGEAHATDDEE
jgi:hypothetical protein